MDTTTTTPAAHGREVNNADVIEFASKKCRLCFGSGELVKSIPEEGEPLKKVNSRETVLCGCAKDRFMRANVHNLVRNGGAIHWADPSKT
jgi:hypothetical protein